MKKNINKQNNKELKLRELILPNQRINFFVTTILILGIISGSIFLMISSEIDKNNVITQIQNFIQNLNNNINSGLALKNSLIINYIFISTIWILGLSIIGIIINIFLTYIKGFLVGFSISSIFLTYKTKGILIAILYVFPSQILNIIIITVLTIYSIMFTNNLLKIITSKQGNNRLMLKKYLIILMFSIILSFISSLLEAYLFPNLLKLITSLYK